MQFRESCASQRTITTSSATATRHVGEGIGRHVQSGTLILLSGPLGSGKTALSQGIAEGLGIAGVINSPTFTILKEYHTGRLPFYHFDLYRINDEQELWELGFDRYFEGDGVAVVEWAERTPGAWNADYLHIVFDRLSVNRRSLTLCAHGPVTSQLISTF